MREKYESLSLATLKDLAKARGLKGVSGIEKTGIESRECFTKMNWKVRQKTGNSPGETAAE